MNESIGILIEMLIVYETFSEKDLDMKVNYIQNSLEIHQMNLV